MQQLQEISSCCIKKDVRIGNCIIWCFPFFHFRALKPSSYSKNKLIKVNFFPLSRPLRGSILTCGNFLTFIWPNITQNKYQIKITSTHTPLTLEKNQTAGIFTDNCCINKRFFVSILKLSRLLVAAVRFPALTNPWPEMICTLFIFSKEIMTLSKCKDFLKW